MGELKCRVCKGFPLYIAKIRYTCD